MALVNLFMIHPVPLKLKFDNEPNVVLKYLEFMVDVIIGLPAHSIWSSLLNSGFSYE